MIGGNIEYIVNSDSHPGAQFSSEFRSLVKSEIAKLSANRDQEVAQAETPKRPAPSKPESVIEERPKHQLKDLTALLDSLSNSVDSGNLLIERRLTVADLIYYSKRTYHVSHSAEDLSGAEFQTAGGHVSPPIALILIATC